MKDPNSALDGKVVDKYRLIHWLNIRKTTVEVLNQLLSNKINRKLIYSLFYLSK